jgi:hypothetical protein
MRSARPPLLLAVAWLFPAACAGSEVDGFEVEVTLGPLPERSSAAPLVLRNDRGYTVEIDRAYVVTSTVELEGCDGTAAAGWRRYLAWEGTAWAHEHGSPTRLGAPFVQALVGGGEPGGTLGTLRPPPARYCRVRVGLGPADADARGLPEDLRLVGKTCFVAGRFRADGGEAQAFTVASTAALEVELPLGPLVLAEESPRRRALLLGLHAAHWFDGVDFATMAGGEIAGRLLEGMRASLTVTTP